MICAETRWSSATGSGGGTISGRKSTSRMSPSTVSGRVMFNSPLWRKDSIKNLSTPEPTPDQVKELEDLFILDCISIEKRRYKWSPDIIPKYDALRDHYARAYFLSPLVQRVLKKTVYAEGKRNTKDDESQARWSNTLSGRRRLPRPPTAVQLQEKRHEFIVDSVVATNAVTKYPFRPLVPTYNSLKDSHTMGYLRKKGVHSVMSRTIPEELPSGAMFRMQRAKVGVRSTVPSLIGSSNRALATNTSTQETTPPILPKLATQKTK
ncbi:uncharacterized protein [Antedon mediterranea]|uniref:uncharacterized protein isoform X1 n=1 Tax=Antedon mediterranea TaxID=105859 RepID=UPI003AF91C68